MNKRFYEYILNFSAIAAGAQGQALLTLDNPDFMIEYRNTVCYLNAAGGGAIIKTPLYRVPSPTVGSNTHAALCMVRYELFVARARLFSNAPIRADLFGGDALQPSWLKTPILVSGRQEISCIIYNDSAVAIDGQIVLGGYQVGENLATRL